MRFFAVGTSSNEFFEYKAPAATITNKQSSNNDGSDKPKVTNTNTLYDRGVIMQARMYIHMHACVWQEP
ncbi:unnamed protein product [Ceratitis capitata]|uniref:(Mediterranean fruit fly) hypothetical protein n=1 Tax=Ceratitis capitata TaxID=7213 RepID=A0A811UC74_CERCA|nr:unnamed protein product [Ceratitis capitata]